MARKRNESLREIILIQKSLGGYFDEEKASTGTIVRTWSPPVDLYETSKKIFLNADLPGLEERDLKIEVHGNVITLQGQRRVHAQGGKGFMRVERNYGPFQRTFRLPSTVKEGSVKAVFKLGILKIEMVKDIRPEPEYTKIRVETEG